MGSIIGLELAAKKISGSSSGLAEGLACCVKDVPLRSTVSLVSMVVDIFVPPKINNIFDKSTGRY